MKISLIIDGNYLLHRVIFPLIEARTLYGELYSAMSTTLNKQIEMYPFDQIWFVSDDRFSWRKTVQQDYKGNRVKDDKIDWEFIYNTYDAATKTSTHKSAAINTFKFCHLFYKIIKFFCRHIIVISQTCM